MSPEVVNHPLTSHNLYHHLRSPLSSGTATPINHSNTPHPHPLSHPHPYFHHSPPQHHETNSYSPAETLEIVSRLGVKKAHTPVHKVFLSSIAAGVILSFACATYISTSASPWYAENAPGLLRTLGALVFPYGLVVIQLSGTDLCTGSFMYTGLAGLVMQRVKWWIVLRHWGVTFLGNLAGCLAVVGILIGGGDIFSNEAYTHAAVSFAHKKQVSPTFHEIFLRAIGANFLVCMACYLGCSGRDLASKIMGIWWPTFAFVSLGLDHVVANMFFMPCALILGDKEFTIGEYVGTGMVSALLGNIVGGFVFVGCLMWVLHAWEKEDVAVDGEYFDTKEEHVDDQKKGKKWWQRRPEAVIGGHEKV